VDRFSGKQTCRCVHSHRSAGVALDRGEASRADAQLHCHRSLLEAIRNSFRANGASSRHSLAFHGLRYILKLHQKFSAFLQTVPAARPHRSETCPEQHTPKCSINCESSLHGMGEEWAAINLQRITRVASTFKLNPAPALECIFCLDVMLRFS